MLALRRSMGDEDYNNQLKWKQLEYQLYMEEAKRGEGISLKDLATILDKFSSIDSRVVEAAGPGNLARLAALQSLDDDLRFVLLTSAAKVTPAPEGGDLLVTVTPSQHAKCERCWHYRADVGHNPAHPTLCGRCDSNLFGAGESRSFA